MFLIYKSDVLPSEYDNIQNWFNYFINFRMV